MLIKIENLCESYTWAIYSQIGDNAVRVWLEVLQYRLMRKLF